MDYLYALKSKNTHLYALKCFALNLIMYSVSRLAYVRELDVVKEFLTLIIGCLFKS